MPMFKRKQRELTTEDAPDSIEPWLMLEEAEIAAQTARLRERWPDRHLIAIARRVDRDTLACFDKGPAGTGKAVVVIENADQPDETTEQHYQGFSGWFDAALADGRGM